MPPTKRIQHDEIVLRFSERLRLLRLSCGMSQAELARQAQCTTNYISKLEASGAAPGIDLVARLAKALGVPIAELLPMVVDQDELEVTRKQAKKLFDDLV
jgi:transcriptional regulator with XRE-family HTH domain